MEKQEQDKAIKGLQDEKRKVTDIFARKMETNIKLKESLDNDKKLMEEKENEFEELRNNINYL